MKQEGIPEREAEVRERESCIDFLGFEKGIEEEAMVKKQEDEQEKEEREDEEGDGMLLNIETVI